MAKLIKKGSAAEHDVTVDAVRSSAAIINKDTYEAKGEAQRILDDARAAADEILEKANVAAKTLGTEATQAAEKLRVKAHEEGYAAGKTQATTELSETVAHLVAATAALEDEVVPKLHQLAVAIARKIIGTELQQHPEQIVKIIKQALFEKARQRTLVVLRVHPDDLDTVKKHRAELLDVLSRCKEIGVQADPQVTPHGLIIETEAGTVDAQLETQLQIFEKVLQGVK